jgi:hypothetical protein
MCHDETSILFAIADLRFAICDWNAKRRAAQNTNPALSSGAGSIRNTSSGLKGIGYNRCFAFQNRKSAFANLPLIA